MIHYPWKLVSTAAIAALAMTMAFAQDHHGSSGSSGSSHSSGGSRDTAAVRGGTWHVYRGGSSGSSGSQSGTRFGGTVGGTTGSGAGSNARPVAESHNLSGFVGGNVSPGRIGPTSPIIHANTLIGRVHEGDRVGLFVGGVRYGYYHYNSRFHDDHFFFGFYVFDPFLYDTCVCSPWYYYPCMPPYLAYNRVVIVDNYYSTGWAGQPYYWDDSAPASRSDLDLALQDMVSAFQDDDRRAIGRLVPRDGQVNIYTEGNYSYSVGVDEFYDLYKDGIENVHTDKYQITRVETNAKGDARVEARHDYVDPWNKPQTVYHTYYLARQGHDYVIREFGTSYDPKGW